MVAAAALRHLDRALLGGPPVGGRQAEILLEAHVAFLQAADRAGGHQHVHVDAVGRSDQVEAAPALAHQFAHHRHGQPGGQAAAERDHRAVADQGYRVAEAGSFVARWLQAHDDPPRVLRGRPPGAAAGRTPGPAGGFDRGGQHGVVDRGERRGVAEIKRGQVRHGQSGVQRRGQHVDALRGAFPARHLAAEQSAIGRVHQPDVHR